MTKILSNNYLQFLLRVILGIVFVFAGIEKIAEPAGFAESVINYRVLPLFLINITAIVIPWLEVIAGILLIYGNRIKENTVIITSLLVLFNVLVLQAVIRGLDIECGCFGTLDAQRVGFQKLMENFVLITFGVVIFLFDKGESRA